MPSTPDTGSAMSLAELIREMLGELPDGGDRSVDTTPLDNEALAYLRRQRPDLALEPIPHSAGYRLRADRAAMLELAHWAGEGLADGIEALAADDAGTDASPDDEAVDDTDAGRGEFEILLWHERDLGKLPDRLAGRMSELGYRAGRPERWVFAKESGDPALSSFAGGNSIHHHRDAAAAAARLRDDLAAFLPLVLVPHGDSDRLFEGSEWRFERSLMYVFLVEQPGRWEAAAVAVTEYRPPLDSPAASQDLLRELLSEMGLSQIASSAVIPSAFEDTMRELLESARRHKESEPDRPAGLVLFVTGYVHWVERAYLLLPGDEKDRLPFRALDLEDLIRWLGVAFDRVVLVVDGQRTGPAFEKAAPNIPDAVWRAPVGSAAPDHLLLLGEVDSPGSLTRLAIDLILDSENRGKLDSRGLAKQAQRRMQGRVQISTGGNAFPIELASQMMAP